MTTPMIRYLWLNQTNARKRLQEILELFQNCKGMVWSEKQILCERKGKWQTSLLLQKNENLIGFAFNSIKSGNLHIHVIFITPKLRRKGLASKMLIRLKKRAAELRLSGLQLKVGANNHKAIALYKSLGFQTVRVTYKKNTGKLRHMTLPNKKAMFL